MNINIVMLLRCNDKAAMVAPFPDGYVGVHYRSIAKTGQAIGVQDDQ